jgi:outer membrane protein OmpA-like peptidoglycan-associated protein
MRARHLMSGVALLALAACAHREAGSEVDQGTFGNANMNNILVQSGERDYVIALQERFNQEVPDTITFAFDSAVLDEAAIRTLRHQANWIKQFPELRFSVYGHADAVGSNAYNYNLGLRRANAVVGYFASQGISRSRLQALVSFGETRPVVQTANEERRNRRTVTEVAGFLKRHPTLLNGKYAEVIFREYIKLAERAHPPVTNIKTQVDPGGN